MNKDKDNIVYIVRDEEFNVDSVDGGAMLYDDSILELDTVVLLDKERMLLDIAAMIDRSESSLETAREIVDYLRKNSYEQKIAFDDRFDG